MVSLGAYSTPFLPVSRTSRCIHLPYLIPLVSVAAASGVLSPISLFIACSILFLFRPILLELGSAVRLNGANYTYLLQFSGKTLALIGAAATLLDAMATSTVSSATAAAYLAGEVPNLGMPQAVLALSLLVGLCLIGFFRVKESSTVTLTFTVVHVRASGRAFRRVILRRLRGSFFQ
jgi:amino acid transporter